MDGDRNSASVRMLHEVVATGDPRDGEPRAFERFYDLRSRYDWDATRHKPGRYYNSGDVECQSEFVRYPDLFDQQLKPGTQVRDRLFLRRAIADSADARTEQSRGTPYAVFILLDGVRHVNDTSHGSIMPQWSRPCICMPRQAYPGTSRDVLSSNRRKEHVNPEGSDAR
jgi:hypothetical protein